MRTTKLLTTFALALVVLIAGCSKDEFTPTSTKLSSRKSSEQVSLGLAGNFAILSKSGITNVPPSVITGDIGVSPIAASAITGFALILDGSGTFSTSAQVNGKVYAADYADPTPATLTTAVLDMETAYTNAAGQPATSAATTNVGAGTLIDLTLAPGVYEWGSTLTIPTDLTLSGSATDIWIFKIAGTLNIASFKKVILTGGALAQNIFWQVSGAVTLGTYSHFEGTILGKTYIAMQTGASINGRLLAQTAVTLDQNIVNGITGDGTVPPPIPEPCRDFVTGGGWIKGNSGGWGHKDDKATFGVSGGMKNDKFWGQLSYNDHGKNGGVKVKSTRITDYVVLDPVTRRIEGNARLNNNTTVTFIVIVADKGKSGRNDTFSLVLSNGYSASGTLEGGNIQLHKNCDGKKDKNERENYNDGDERDGHDSCDKDDKDWNKGRDNDRDDHNKGKGRH